MIRAAHQRAGLHVAESQPEGRLLEPREFVRRVVAVHRQMGHRRPQVLANRQEIATGAPQVRQRRLYLGPALAEPDHQPRLRRDAGRQPFRPREQLQGAGVAPAGTCAAVQPLHRFDVVIQHVGAGLEHLVEVAFPSAEVRDQHLDAAARRLPADGPDRVGENPGAAVFQVVAVDRRNHHVPQLQPGGGCRNALRLGAVDGARPPVITLQ